MKRLGNRKKIVAAGDYVPANRKIQFLHQGDDAVQHFGHPAADGCRVNHLNGAPFQAGGQRAQLGNFCATQQTGIVIDLVGTRLHTGLGHWTGSLSMSPIILVRTLSSVLV